MRALVREVPGCFAQALAMEAPAVPIDVAAARVEHARYCDALAAAGVAVTVLAADERYPDCCFVEDIAVVAGGLALITHPGAPSRRGETIAVAAALAPHLELARMVAPATLDGGDCMRVGSTIYAGRSARTNAAGIARLAEVFAPRGFRVIEIDVPADLLHLKSVCSPLGDDRILLARDTLPAASFPGTDIVWVDAEDDYAANALAIGSSVLVAAEYPRTHDVLAAAGLTPIPVATAEIRKADGQLTCGSILF